VETAHEFSPNNRMIFDFNHFYFFRFSDENRTVFGGQAASLPEN